MKVYLSPEAEEQAEVCDSWWREERANSRDLFARELMLTLEQLELTPKIGVVASMVRGKAVRRFLMPRTRHHIYYEIEDSGDIVVHAIWGAPKGRTPRLR